MSAFHKHRRLNFLGTQYVHATVSYLLVGTERRATYAGQGKTVAEAVRACDDQLPSGEWLRVCISTPSTILQDLRYGRRLMSPGHELGRHSPLASLGEGKTVRR